MKRIILLTVLLFIIPGISQAKSSKELIVKEIENINFQSAVKDVCQINKEVCRVLTDKQIYPYLKKHYKKALYSIAFSESSFKYKYGTIDKNDRGYFQINTRTWSPEKIKRMFGIRTTIWSLTHNVKVQTKVALRIWLYNTAIYILSKRKFPRNLAQYACLYHNPNYISKTYERKVKKVVYKVKF